EVDVGGSPAACTTQSTQIDIGLGPNIGIIQTDVEVESLLEGRRGCPSSCCRGGSLRSARFACQIARVGRIDLVAKACGLQPDFTLSAGANLEFARDRVERCQILALCVDLQQLEVDLEAAGMRIEGFFENLLSLCITPV